MKTLADRKIAPENIPPKILRQLEAMITEDDRRPLCIGRDATHVEAPPALTDLLIYVIRALARKQAVVILAEDAAFSTQAAADFLGLSRPQLLRLMETGKIPFHFAGSHRRVRFQDLRNYQQERDQMRAKTLDALTDTFDEAGLYDRV